MTTEDDILVLLEGAPKGCYVFWCPGCEFAHQIDKRWTLTGTLACPTIRASILVTSPRPDGTRRCHSFVTDGQIQFLNDCSHALAGKTVPLLPWSKVP